MKRKTSKLTPDFHLRQPKPMTLSSERRCGGGSGVGRNYPRGQARSDDTCNSGTKRRHKGALPLVGESEVTRASEVKC
jgi:hypothetical protein